MEKDTDHLISPTLAKVLDAFWEAMKSDAEIQDEAANRLNVLLRGGKTPKPDEINDALFLSTPKDEVEGVEGGGA